MKLIQKVIQTWKGVTYLVWLGWKVRYNFKHPFVQWRLDTFYKDPEWKWNWKRIKEMIRYGAWASDMRKRMK